MKHFADIKRAYACSLAFHFIGLWYKWGGNNPDGFDCSGFVVELLKSVGILPRKYDNTARGLYSHFGGKKVDKPCKGCLVFFGEPIINHIEFCIDKDFSIGASGGGGFVKTIEDAIHYNAYIKMRPIKRNRHIVGYVDPFLEI